MKKTVKNLLIVILMAVLVFSLAGCGKTEEDNVDRLVATKEITDEDDSFGIGSYTETYEMTFKDNKADTITITMEFKDEESAQTLADFYSALTGEEDSDSIKVEGNKFIMSMSYSEYWNDEGDEYDENTYTKEYWTEYFKGEGYTIK